MSLNEIFKVRRFCIYCRASEEFCTCNNEIKFAVWEHAIKQDVKEAVEGAKKDLKEGITCQCGNAYRCPNHNLINKIWEKRFGEFK